ncbi:hypothetical protein MCAP1_000144 [Malassezia caprae]|uniref:Conserved oligomeric Golgi complex subunit 3 n=1 Tax=Malassezia caprae TaxID=1381934 RepID=A0AAF0IUY1_9BASI|nr:hypothetical protein MCAP1_000144 [Malassezia caprae]
MATTPALSLDDWYTQYAPLSDAQRVSVSRVSAWVSAQRDRAELAQPSPEPSPSTPGMCLTQRLASMAAQRALAQDSNDTHDLVVLQDSLRELDQLGGQIAQVQGSMAELRAGLAYVQDSSSDLMAQASRLLSDQNDLERKHDDIMLRLGYFSVLPPATALLSSASTSVDTPEFRSTVDRLLLALKFMASHRQYMDAPVYQLRLLNALQRAMSIVRQSFAAAGTDLVNELLMQMREMLHVRDYATESSLLDPSSPLVSDLLYGHFEPLRDKYAKFMEDLVGLAAQHEELRGVWHDTQTLWCQWRVSLLRDCLAACTSSTGEPTMPLRARLEQVLTSLAQYSEQEKALSERVFPGTAADASWLEKVWATIYERAHAWLAPQWTALDLKAVAELAAAAQHYRIEPWCMPLYSELVERLERSATAAYKSEVVSFVPSRDDMAYPAVLRDWQRTSSSSAPGSSDAALSTWYAPVRTVHALLEALRPHLPPSALASWTYRAVQTCQQKVQEASNAMRADKVGSDDGDAGDALLFQLQHLLILQVQVQQNRACVGDMDAPVAAPRNASSSALWFLGSWGSAPSRPSTLSSLLEDLEAAITATANEIGTYLGASLALPLQIFMQQAGGTPDKAWQAWTVFQQSVDANVDDMRVKLPLYVDPQEVETLVKATLHTLRTTYEAFLARWQALVAPASSEASARLSDVPSPEQLCTQLGEKLLTGAS